VQSANSLRRAELENIDHRTEILTRVADQSRLQHSSDCQDSSQRQQKCPIPTFELVGKYEVSLPLKLTFLVTCIGWQTLEGEHCS